MSNTKLVGEAPKNVNVLMALWRNDGCMMGCGLFVLGILTLSCIGIALSSGFIKP